MLFTSTTFCLFLVILFIGYYTVFRNIQWQFLLVASFVFYAFSGWTNLIYISVTICSTWFAGHMISRIRDRQAQHLSDSPELSKEDKKAYKAAQKTKMRRWLIAAMLFNFAILAVVKYAGFAIQNTNALLELFGKQPFSMVNFILPMGISFYTFQTMGYIIDVYRGSESEPSLFKLGLFVSFFPQLIQGPISRFGDLNKTLFSAHRFDRENFLAGLMRIMLGFFKKLVVADRLLVAVRTLAGSPEEFFGAHALFVVLIYAVTLYCDFTGGIDITIGVAKILGIDIKENFNRPFYATSTADYWRRWHITMGTWFKDYLFYPISASNPMMKLYKSAKKRAGEGLAKRAAVYISTIILWFATGLWHGAQWNFIVWGLLNGVVIVISEELSPLYAKFHKRFPFGKTLGYRAFQVFRTFWLMSLIRTLDVYANVRLTFRMYASILTDFGWARVVSQGLDAFGIGLSECVAAGVAVIIMIAAGYMRHNKKIESSARWPMIRVALIAALAFAVLIFGVYGFGYDSNQFIYNQF